MAINYYSTKMAINYYPTKLGTVRVERTCGDITQRFTVQIRTGNCLAVFISVTPIKDGPNKGKYLHQLFSFFCDDAHVKNMMKSGHGKVFGSEKIISIRLNMFYKENYKLLKYFVQSGYKVICYYKEENN